MGSLTECVELFGDTDRVFVVGGISPLIDYANQLRILEMVFYNNAKGLYNLDMWRDHD